MDTSPPPPTTRLAPSPTGALHLGNARTFLINWALARQRSWRVVLRIEDLDGPRVKAGADAQAVADLAWLGLDWDSGPNWQRADLSPYTAALESLARRSLIYRCICSRSDVQRAQSAPHADDHEVRYPGTCRPAVPASATREAPGPAASGPAAPGPAASGPARGSGGTGVPPVDPPVPVPAAGGSPADHVWRLIVPDDPIDIADEFAGPHRFNVQREVGDYIVATRAGLPAYQLAVVVDDARQGVTAIVRGDDLLPSAARQAWLYRFLDAGPTPHYWHLPLVRGPDGRRLAKRHGDTRLATYRAQGVPSERIIGLIAWWSGAARERRPMSAREFAAAFRIEALPRTPVTFAAEDHAWLVRP